MCGITGIIDRSNLSFDIETLRAMTDALVHRGPDGFGYKHWSCCNSNIGFGHRRLSIIDLSEGGAQPMQKHNSWLTFNGEIYNFKEIQKELKEKGYSFRSNSDTEMILSAYDCWGMDCVKRFRGMFAFAIFDEEKRKILLVRDRIGIKPLFLYQSSGLTLFASELKSFHKHPKFNKELNKHAVQLYFKYGFVPSPLSIFKNTHKLKPGYILEMNLENNDIKEIQYWNPNDYVTNEEYQNLSLEEIEQRVESLLQESFEYRLVADVPVGVFLSGGYDSSLVTALLQKDRTEKINTFTIGFENDTYNESPHAEKVAKHLGTNHYTHICTKKETQDIIPILPHYYDEPFADSSAIPTFLVSKITSEHVKVALSADGGDELFSGYNRNKRFVSIKNDLDKIPKLFRRSLSSLTQLISNAYINSPNKSIRWDKISSVLKDSSLLEIINIYPQYFTDSIINKIISNQKNSSKFLNPLEDLKGNLKGIKDEFNALLSFDYQSTLTNDMLVKVDRASMANSLEGRDPMLDHKIYEFISSIPSEKKMYGGELKYFLKNITHKYIPKSIMQRPKMGFGIPINDWLKNDLNYLIQDNLNNQELDRHGIFNTKKMSKLIKTVSNYTDNNNQLWLILSFQMWAKKWL